MPSASILAILLPISSGEWPMRRWEKGISQGRIGAGPAIWVIRNRAIGHGCKQKGQSDAPFDDFRPAGRFKGPNDLVFASNGDLCFTDQGKTGLHNPSGRVSRYTATGFRQALIETLPGPNGLVLSPDGTLGSGSGVGCRLRAAAASGHFKSDYGRRP